MRRSVEHEEDEHAPDPLKPSPLAARPDPARARVLSLQQHVGNAAVSAMLARTPQDAGFLGLPIPRNPNQSHPGDDPIAQIEEIERAEQARYVPFDPGRGDPIPGFTSPRTTYSPADRNGINKQFTKRMADHNENVSHFESTFCQSLVSQWGNHLTSEMKKAGTPKDLPMWAKITKFVAEAALAAVLPGGIGLLAGGLLNVTFGKTATFIGEHLRASRWTSSVTTSATRRPAKSANWPRRRASSTTRPR